MATRPTFGYTTDIDNDEDTEPVSLSLALNHLERHMARQNTTQPVPPPGPSTVRIGRHTYATAEPIPRDVHQLLSLGVPSPDLTFNPQLLRLLHPNAVGVPGGLVDLRPNILTTLQSAVPSSERLRSTVSYPETGAMLPPPRPAHANVATSPRNQQSEQAPWKRLKWITPLPRQVVRKPDIHFQSKENDFLARFLKTIHRQPEMAYRVKSLSFTLPYDTLYSGGVLQLLKVNMADELFAEDEQEGEEEEGSDVEQADPLKIAEEQLKLQIALFGSPMNIPLKHVLDMYVYLFSICKMVERVEIPLEWEKDFSCGSMFPLVRHGDLWVKEDA